MFFTGSCIYGQGGISTSDENISRPRRIAASSLYTEQLSRITSTARNTYLLKEQGEVCSCGSNDEGELARQGKRSVFHRIDSLEAFKISDVCAGDGYVLFLKSDGKMLGFGHQNSFGQLGCGDREPRKMPRPIQYTEGILQISCGSQHTVAITQSGAVLTWGGNKKGQLGDGQLTSSNVPLRLKQLKHRPIINIQCGENHTLAVTITGNLYVWGDNTCGQLGLGDETNRLRPELVRSLRSSRVSKISAGKSHSAIITKIGLCLAFGSNSNGQCGVPIDERKKVLSPNVVERLRELKTLDVCCGSAHTMTVIKGEGGRNNRVFAFGQNSSGQLGLDTFASSALPTPLTFNQSTMVEADSSNGGDVSNDDFNPLYVRSGPLAFHTFIISDKVKLTNPKLPSVDLQSLEYLTSELNESTAKMQTIESDGNKRESSSCNSNSSSSSTDNDYNLALRVLREHIAAAFSSISVINASFHSTSDDCFISYNSSSLSIDLKQVRRAYEHILCTENEQVLNTLGRATLQLSDDLKECQFDDSENLSVFLIVLENPLLLKPIHYQVVLERIIAGILALPKSSRLRLFGWLKSYESEYFARVLHVCQYFLHYTLTNKLSVGDSAPIVLVLQSLYECNKEVNVIPESMFYSDVVSKNINLRQEWMACKINKRDGLSVFNYCAYPFLLPILDKATLIRDESKELMNQQINTHMNKYIYDSLRPLPKGLGVLYDPEDISRSKALQAFFDLKVRRDELFFDAIKQLVDAYKDDPDTLALPLRVEFLNEDALDDGGVRKELLTVLMQDFVSVGVLSKCGTNNSLVWFNENFDASSLGELSTILRGVDVYFIVGLVIGLAVHNSVLINFPVPSSVYKLMAGVKLDLSDLWNADEDLARGIQGVLNIEDGVGSLGELLGITFEASMNPLIDSRSTSRNKTESAEDNKSKYKYINLVPGGSELLVERGNRAKFVELFLNHVLYNSVKPCMDEFLLGLKFLLRSSIYDNCTHQELDLLINGNTELGDLSMLRIHTKYKGDYHDEHRVINWFWNTISAFSPIQHRKLLHFITGSDRVPIGGLQHLKFIIQSNHQPSSSIPVAHTCFNTLDVPVTYENEETMKNKLLIALEHFSGFGLL